MSGVSRLRAAKKGGGPLSIEHGPQDTAVHGGAKDVSLTSRPSREAANRLYQRIGFQARDTNVYRYTF